MARSTDPSRTKSLRDRYSRNLRGAFSRINTVIREGVIEEDVFGLNGAGELTADVDPPGDYSFRSDDQKVEAFVDWLEDAQANEVLEVIQEDQNTYVRNAYERGIKNVHSDLRGQGVDISEDDVARLINQPIHQDKLQQLYTRNFRELKGITEAVDQQVSRELTEGLLQGDNPRDIARRITDRVDKIGKTRATTLARTEILNAHNESALTRYEQVLGDEAEVTVEAEILTAQDNRVCDICEPRHGDTMSIDDARANGPPWHPRCRCTYRANYSN